MNFAHNRLCAGKGWAEFVDGPLLRLGSCSPRMVRPAPLAVLDELDGPIGAEIFHDPGPDGLTRSVFVDPLHRLLLDGAIDGTVHADDPRETATVLYNAVGHTYRHLRSGHGWSPQRARDGVLALVMDGSRRRSSRCPRVSGARYRLRRESARDPSARHPDR